MKINQVIKVGELYLLFSLTLTYACENVHYHVTETDFLFFDIQSLLNLNYFFVYLNL